MDEKTRSMSVEVDVSNPNSRLAPGMYPSVMWPVRSSKPSLLVPPSSIVTTTERTFVIRVRGDKAEWVNISRGAPVGDLVTVVGALQPGDTILKRASDEIREGSVVK
jgi:membrane fusion protein (multidrug efflux system)